MVWVDVFIAVSLLIMALIDLKTRYIYDFHIIFTGFLICIKLIGSNYIYHFYGAMLGFIIGYLMYKAAYLYYSQEAFGFGDVLLLMLLGLYFGWPLFIHYFAVCYMLIGLVIILPIFFKPSILKAEVPMGPFYIFGAFAFKYMGSPSCIDLVSRMLEYI